MATVTLTWVDPTQRTDGSTLDPTDIADVTVWDAVNGAAAVQIGEVSGDTETFTTGLLVGGSHVFTVEVVDTAGDDSAMSAPVTVAVPLAPPNPATNVVATLNS
jgi:hypothetical protein